MDGQLIAPIPLPDQDQRFYHRHVEDEVELEAGTATTITWRGIEHVRTIYRCPACGQQVERMEPLVR